MTQTLQSFQGEVRCCALIPTYNNPKTLRSVVEQTRALLPDVIVVDDGSGPEGRAECAAVARDGLARVVHLEQNEGKGSAVLRGFDWARELGFSHCFQIDADSQHDLNCIPEFLRQAQQNPDALIAGYPVYDDTAPGVRKVARKITAFWVAVEIGSGVIADALIGFRVYPLHQLAKIRIAAKRMDFDTEVAVRLRWIGAPIVNMPVAIRYLQPEDGGISHFRPSDNFRLFMLHSRLCTERCMRWVLPGTSAASPNQGG